MINEPQTSWIQTEWRNEKRKKKGGGGVRAQLFDRVHELVPDEAVGEVSCRSGRKMPCREVKHGVRKLTSCGKRSGQRRSRPCV